MSPILWLILMVVLVAIEIATLGLTTIWFAGGAFFAFMLSLLGVSWQVQLSVFVVVSFVLLIFTRPVAMRYLNKKTTKTNAESLVGKTARVTSHIDNLQAMGSASLNGQEWTARSYRDDECIEPGALARIVEVRGVKLILEPVEEVVKEEPMKEEL